MKKQKGKICLDNRLLNSSAFMKLSSLAQSVYLRFRQKMQWEKVNVGKRKNNWVNTNNGEIVFPYKEAKDYGFSGPSFTKALDELIEHGFIDMTFKGGLLNTPSRFAISNRWEKYGTPEFKLIKQPKGKKTNKDS
jgi:hypothetical protein